MPNLLEPVKVFIRQAQRDGMDGWEVTYAGMTRFTPDRWQAEVYYHQAMQSYGFTESIDDVSSLLKSDAPTFPSGLY